MLSGLGVGAASILVGTLGCGGGERAVRRGKRVEHSSDDVRAWLRAAVEQLRTEFPVASAHAVVARRITAASDLRGTGVVRAQHVAVVLRVADDRGQVAERGAGELTRDAIFRLAVAMRRGKTGGRGLQPGTPRRDGPTGEADRSDAGWIGLVDELARRADAATASRVIYRGAWHETDDATIWHVTDGVDREQRLVRSRAGVVFVAWGGARPLVGEAVRGVAGGADQVALADADIARARDAALELTTPGTVPSGPATVVLHPAVVARLADAALAPLLTTPAWLRPDGAARARAGQRIAAPLVTVRADPDPRRYGGYYFDDEGVTPAGTSLVEAGILRAPVGDRRGAAAVDGAAVGGGLRPGHAGPARAAIGHLAWIAGPGPVASRLHEGLDDAWIVEDPGPAHVDVGTWTVTLAAGRARRIRKGVRTGHVYPDVELVAAVPALLADTSRVSSDVDTFAHRDGDVVDARWRSIEAPAIVTRMTLAPRGAKESG